MQIDKGLMQVGIEKIWGFDFVFQGLEVLELEVFCVWDFELRWVIGKKKLLLVVDFDYIVFNFVWFLEVFVEERIYMLSVYFGFNLVNSSEKIVGM